jgi:hypothetical protein
MAEEKETKELLSCEPERLGHATYLDEEAKEVVLARRTCIEICLTSNLLCVIFSPPFLRPSFSPPREFELSVFVLGGISYPMAYRCKSVQQLQDHHIRYYLARNHPIVICVRPPPLFIYIFSAYATSPFYLYVRSVASLAHLVPCICPNRPMTSCRSVTPS